MLCSHRPRRVRLPLPKPPNPPANLRPRPSLRHSLNQRPRSPLPQPPAISNLHGRSSNEIAAPEAALARAEDAAATGAETEAGVAVADAGSKAGEAVALSKAAATFRHRNMPLRDPMCRDLPNQPAANLRPATSPLFCPENRWPSTRIAPRRHSRPLNLFPRRVSSRPPPRRPRLILCRHFLHPCTRRRSKLPLPNRLQSMWQRALSCRPMWRRPRKPRKHGVGAVRRALPPGLRFISLAR